MRNLKVIDYHDFWAPLDKIHSLSVDPWSSVTIFTSKDRILVWNGSKFIEHNEGIGGAFLLCESTEFPEFCVVTTHGLYVWHYSGNKIVADFPVPTGIKCASFSPEKSLLAFITEDHQVSLVTPTLEFVASFDLKEEGFGSASPVTIGWGKKETQFHGSAGKEAALAKPKQTLSRSQHDDGRLEIAWREDGKYFAVSYNDASAQSSRRFRVFTQSGDLFSTSEPNGLIEPGFYWRPRIQLITAVQRRPARGLDIIFFETNAERHGEFELLDGSLESRYRIGTIQFDSHGDVLAVLCCSLASNTENQTAFIRLLTCSNYQWFAKRDISFGSILNTALNVVFTWGCDASHNNLRSLYVAASLPQNPSIQTTDTATAGTLVRKWSFSLMYDGIDCMATYLTANNNQLKSKNPGLVGVVDGNTVLLTALAHAVIPPPMYATRLTLSSLNTSPAVRDPRLVSLSFPGPWVRTAPDSDRIPLLLQLESDQLLLVQLVCGTNGMRQQAMKTDLYLVEAQWMCGAQNTVPWPVQANNFRLMDCMDLSTNPDVQRALTDAAHLATCGGSELTHFCWLDCQHVLFVGCGGRLVGLLSILDESGNFKGRWLLSLISTSRAEADLDRAAYDARICGLCNTPGQFLCVQLTDGRVFLFAGDQLLGAPDCVSIDSSQQSLDVTDCSTANPLYWTFRFPLACEQLNAVRFTEVITNRMKSKPFTSKEVTTESSRIFLLGLHHSSHRLYAAVIPTPAERSHLTYQLGQQKPLTCAMELCSSLLVLPNYVLVTSIRKILMCVPTEFRAEVLLDPEACLMELIARLEVPTEITSGSSMGSRNWYDDFLHPIEVGAVLVRALPDDTKVILQMPRGNLEEAHPRALVLSHLSVLLDKMQFAQALEAMRRHRVSLNLLYDHNPTVFCTHLELLLSQLTNPEPITLFVSELTEEDVSQSMYGKFYGRGISHLIRGKVQQKQQILFTKIGKQSKVNTVCDALLEKMNDVKRYLLPILTCYAKKSPPELSTALLLLKTHHDAGDTGLWESGVRHLQYFATPLELYRVALGTYDLQLALLMAQRTQLDPKEYLAQLNEIRAVTDQEESNAARSYQRFRIDDHLTRYASALRHLHDSGPQHSSETIEYVRMHRLYRDAVELFQSGSEEFKVVSRMWAEHLMSEQKLSLSGEVYLRAGFFAAAARTFLSTTQPQLWAIAVTQARSSGDTSDELSYLSPSEIKVQAAKLATRLRDLDRYQEAMNIYLDFLQDPETAIIVGLEGGLWLDSRRLAALHGKLDTLDRNLLPKVSEAFAALSERVSNTNDQFTNLVQRLVMLRQQHRDEAESKRLAQLHGSVDPMDDSATETDLFSDTSSLSDSSLSGSTDVRSLRSGVSRKSGRSAKNKRKQNARKWSSKPGSKYEEVGLVKEIAQSVELGQRLAGDVTTLILELWRVGLRENAYQLLSHTNHLLTAQKDALPSVWDDWMTGKAEQADDGRQFEGRKLYSLQEPFMICAPEMKITQVNCHLVLQHK